MMVAGKKSGAWLGLLAIVLHAFVPLAAPAAYAATLSSYGHPHGAVRHSAPHDSAGRLDAHHAHEGAHEAPAAPSTFCIGDCPCCTSHYKIFLVASAASWAIVLPSTAHVQENLAPFPLIIKPVYDHPARAPPLHS